MAVTNFQPTIWAAALQERFAAQSVVIPTVNRQYEGDARKGNAVHITQVTTPTVQNYATNHTHTNDNLTDARITMQIDQEKLIAFVVDDVDRVQSAGSFEPVTRDSANALVEDAESYLLTSMVTDGTSANDPTTPREVATGNEAYTEVLNLRTLLSKNKTPAGNRFLAVNPEYLQLLLGADSKLSNVDTSGMSEGLRDAVVGRLSGFTVVESPLLNPGTPTAVGYHQLAVAYASQIDTVESLRHQTVVGDIVRMLHVYGAKVTRATSVQYFVSGQA